MEGRTKLYTCINCGSPVNELYKKYSPTVLKLSNCSTCNNTADKYVEYDPVVIIIDLILLSKEAYRHVIYNTDFKIHWKLAILLQVVEAYTEWSSSHSSVEEDKHSINLEDVSTTNLDFHKTLLKVAIRTMIFALTMCLLTVFYNKVIRKGTNNQTSMIHVWKCNILSSFGIFLFLPAIIWGQSSIKEFHAMFVQLYTTFSQLLAYKVVCGCPKLWSILVILISNYFKLIVFDSFPIYTNIITHNNYTAYM